MQNIVAKSLDSLAIDLLKCIHPQYLLNWNQITHFFNWKQNIEFQIYIVRENFTFRHEPPLPVTNIIWILYEKYSNDLKDFENILNIS